MEDLLEDWENDHVKNWDANNLLTKLKTWQVSDISAGLTYNGDFKKGSIIAELDIKDDLWFFDCHFKDDPVMPGCLGLDAMWQLVGFYLGWLGNPGKGRALGVGTVKFTGEILKNVKKAKYIIDMKKIMSPGGTTVGMANGLLFADDKKIYSAENLKVGLFK